MRIKTMDACSSNVNECTEEPYRKASPPRRCASCDDLPQFLHVPYVHSGYRHIHQPWTYYVKSIFWGNTETLNVWTHVVGFILILSRFWEALCLRDFKDPHLEPLFSSYLTFLAMFAASSAAHLFSHKSITTNCVLFTADIAAIGLYGFGMILNHYHYSTPVHLQNTVLYQWSIHCGVILSVLVCVGGGMGKVVYTDLRSKTRVLIMASTIGGLYYLSNFPVNNRLKIEVWTEALWSHFKQTFYFHLTAFFFCSRIPERFFPGKFDIIGNSHQLYHVTVILCTQRHLDAIHQDIDNRVIEFAHKNTKALLLLLAVMLLDALVIYILYRFHKHRHQHVTKEGDDPKYN